MHIPVSNELCLSVSFEERIVKKKLFLRKLLKTGIFSENRHQLDYFNVKSIINTLIMREKGLINVIVGVFQN